MNRPKATDELCSTVRATIAGCVVVLTVGILFVVTALLAQGQTTTSEDLFATAYTPWKEALTTVFWVGEEEGPDNGYIQNRSSAWDTEWMSTFGGVDDPYDRCGFAPCDFTPNQSPFYVALPYNDLDDNGQQKENAVRMPWYDAALPKKASQMEGRYVAVHSGTAVCYGQVRDVGPFEEDDIDYVLGTAPNPRNQNQLRAGLDISPAMRDCLGVEDVSRTRWRFVPESAVTTEQSNSTGEYRLELPSANTLGMPFEVTWYAPFPRQNTRSWIGVYEPTDPDQRPIDWERIENYTISGTYTVSVSRAGTYEVRLFDGATYDRVYTESFVIGAAKENGTYSVSLDQVPPAGGTARATWTTPSPQPARRSWVGLYRPEDAHTDPIDWERIPDNVTTGLYEVRIPGTGAYEIRLFRGATYDTVATRQFKATGDAPIPREYVLEMPDKVQPGVEVAATWYTPTTGHEARSWIGVYVENARSQDPLFWERIPETADRGTYLFSLDTPGTYELRLFQGATYDSAAVLPFTVATADMDTVDNSVEDSTSDLDAPYVDDPNSETIVVETEETGTDSSEETGQSTDQTTDNTDIDSNYSDEDQSETTTRPSTDTGDEVTDNVRRHHRHSGYWRHKRTY